ncbi:2-amino-4-hydroxy-6-hydroxymethyldihydropteridine diphosphokinase [Allohahella marinimesophila]|uniref:2-amino-4-hydroxy-6-hydroxymethyldihydropteridine diphosphokinase n=2 Tax=Allohahella marinimesophila TaxID=1054972 RepID=A0ABP7P5L6_9GAMM
MSAARTKVLTGFGIGSNIEPERNVQTALAALRYEFPDLLVSPVYRCKAVGFDGDPFLNLVVATETSQALPELQAMVKSLEAASGRSGQESKYSGRTLDIDILFYGGLVCRTEQIQLPRKDVVKYPYVLKPLTDILPDWVHPERLCTAAELWQGLVDAAESEQRLLHKHGVELTDMRFDRSSGSF